MRRSLSPALPLLCSLALAGCAGVDAASPSLAPRAAERIDPRVPVVAQGQAAPADPVLAERLRDLAGEAAATQPVFAEAADRAAALAGAAGGRGSESWVAAQQALSAAIAVRAPVPRVLAEVDSLAQRQVAEQGGIAPGDLAAIEAAARAVADIDAAQTRRIAAIGASLDR